MLQKIKAFANQERSLERFGLVFATGVSMR